MQSSTSIIDSYESALLACLGSITSHRVVTSKESSKVIRDASKHLDSLSVNLRRQLIEADKQLIMEQS